MGIVQGGGDAAWARAFFGAQTKGRGRRELDPASQAEQVPGGPPAGRCPQCQGPLQALPGVRLETRVPVEMVACPACGFVGLRELPPP